MIVTIPAEPLLIGERDVRLKFWGMPRNPGDPKRVEGTMTIIGDEADLVLDVFRGPRGLPGEPMPIIDVEWDSTVDNIGDLPDVSTMGPADAGRAWLIGTTYYIFVWDRGTGEGHYVSRPAGLRGPRGYPPDMSISAELVPAADPDDPYGEIEVVRAGPDETPSFHLKVPGLRGPQGPSTTIRLAPDYDNSVPPLDGQGPVWNEIKGKWEPGDLSKMATKLYSIPRSAFLPDTYSSTRQEVATLEIEGQPNAWYPDVSGHVRWKRGLLSFAQVEVEIRIGNQGSASGSASLCALAPYDPSTLDAETVANILSHWSDTGDPNRSVSPDSAVARIPAGQAVTVWVIMHKIGGTGSYVLTQDTADVTVRLQPVS